MEKMLKIVAMILVVAAVVFAAGCAGKTTNNAENQTQTQAPDSAEQVNNSTPAEAPSSVETPQTAEPAVTPTVTNGNASENVTENITENTTGNINTITQNGTHISNEVRKRAIAMNHTMSSGTITVNSSD